MTDSDWREQIEALDDPTEILEALRRDWQERTAVHDRRADDAADLERTQDHRGRRRALQYGVAWLEGSGIDDEPVETVKSLCGRLAGAATANPELSSAGSIIGPHHRAFTDELNSMVVQSRDTRALLQDRWGEDPDIDDIPWINDRVRAKAAKAWGLDDAE